VIYLIDYEDFEPPEDWLQKAQAVTDELCEMEDAEERKKLINRKSDLWGELKNRLYQISHGKCWYCEAKEDRSDYHVDHFRPKNRIRAAFGAERDGYWWLAFKWTNYRLACGYCNSSHRGEDGQSRGKSDYFPIRDESRRVTNPDGVVDDEQPFLLDPTVAGEPELLWFMEDGKAYPAAADGTYPYERARTTIELLNLSDDPRIVEARLDLWQHCQRLIRRGEKAYAQYCQGSVVAEQEYKQICREILEKVDALVSAASGG